MPKKVGPRLRKDTPSPFFTGFVTDSSKSKGFTLIELLISVAIIAILSVISIASFEGATNRAAVKNSAQILKTDLRKWQNFAISGAKDPLPGGSPGCNLPNTYEFYWVFTKPNVSPNGYYRYIVGDYFGGGGTPCDELIDQFLPWDNQVRIVAIGTSTDFGVHGPCSVYANVKFQPLGKDTELTCTTLPDSRPPTDPIRTLGVQRDRIYFELKHPRDDLRYRVYVTNRGIIYDRRMP